MSEELKENATEPQDGAQSEEAVAKANAEVLANTPLKERVLRLVIESPADGQIVFPVRRLLSTTFAAKRREFLGKKQDERVKLVSAHILDNICDIIAADPDGIPEFPRDSRPLVARTRDFFSDESYYELMETVYNVYWGAVAPSATFLKSV